MKSTTLIAVIFSAAYVIARAQNADTFVAQGRAFLVQKDLTNANARFAAAVTASSNHETANALYAGTRLLVLPNQPSVMDFLDRLGISRTNRGIYHWSTTVLRDAHGVPIAPSGMSGTDANDLIRTALLPELAAAGSNWAKITSTNFVLNLSSNETSLAEVTVDFGDILLLRSLLHFTEYFGYTVTSWNLDAQLTAIRSLYTNGTLSAERLLADWPQLFTFATTNDLALARQSFSNAAALYLNASDFIRTRPTNVTRLFNYDPDMAMPEADFRTTLTELSKSLNGPVVLTLKTNLAVDLSNHFNGKNPLRAFLPQFAGNAVIAGTLPDATFGTVIQGLAPYEIEHFLGKDKYSGGSFFPGIKIVSQFGFPNRLPDGRFQVVLNAFDGAFFVVQVSTNLKAWADLTSATVREGVLTFVDPNPTTSPQRFYRAVDESAAISVKGTVFDVITGSPIPSATVALSFPFSGLPGITNQTDSAGNYFVIANVPLPFYGSYQLNVTASGYTPFRFDGYPQQNMHLNLPVYLAPPGYHPPNDNFAQRQTLTGTNVVATGFNVGATKEAGEPSHAGSPGGESVWWSWTAPESGALSVDTIGSSFDTALAVYTGSSVTSLTSVAGDVGFRQASRVNFFVVAGTTYQIAVDSGYSGQSGRVVLNVRSTVPLPPQIVFQPQSQSVVAGNYAYFSVSAAGTTPLTYQWRKEGTNLPGAIQTYYSIVNVQTNDASTYSVVVSNAAGDVPSSNAVLTVNQPPAPPNVSH